MPRPPKPPYSPIHKPHVANDHVSWYCDYGMHRFVWDKSTPPVDCPERHAVRTMLVQEMENDRELKIYFLEHIKKPIAEITNKEIIDLVSRIKDHD